MKRSRRFRATADKGGFIRTTLSPLNDSSDARFNLMDMTMLMGLVLGALVIARVLVAH